ncbi:Probable receptor-like protein kinase [Striga hermonthica]|uniref:non-specific serine/threonine protein kinase n=1 Tax=Striga hermonthica TaxID=68872 RepID=A0A9N7N258_STRHE|nr:Probable receptor-like protein kinase [Striga hermonthica]
MKCFSYFKEKASNNRVQKSAPILRQQSQSDVSEAKRVTKSSASPRSIPELYEEKAHNLRVFTFSELKQATDNFSRLLKIGEGGFGCVYKGTIKPVDEKGESLVVAVKKLSRNCYQGHKQWLSEVQFLGIVEHPNLVKLIGYCAVDGERGIQRLLVYEYMPNKSLEDHLFDEAFPVLSWDCRLQIVLGAARGLAYLHEELQVQVIYRDFKSSNVLLDCDFQPKLSDFGLAREGPTAGHTHVSTAVVGTQGYAAPDYVETGHLTSKSDVWSFGVVLYEILTGRQSLDRDRPRHERKLLDWVRGRRFGTIMDPRLEGRYSPGGARRVARLADSCLARSARDRPKMSMVVERLSEIIDLSSATESDNECKKTEIPAERVGPVESAQRRMAHLAKISEHVGGVNRRKFKFRVT